MTKYLSLDISSTTIGYCVFEDNVLIEQGNIKPLKKKPLCQRLSNTKIFFDSFLENKKPDEIIIEDYARKFSSGRSTANTIIVLSTFNEVVSMACFDYNGKIPVKYSVASIRKTLGLSGRSQSKDEVLNEVLKRYPNFKISLNRNKNTKKECYDEADAVALMIHHLEEING